MGNYANINLYKGTHNYPLMKRSELLGNKEEAEIKVERIMDQLDMNKNGTIDYKEFLVANFEKEEIINFNTLKHTLDFFDAALYYFTL